MQNIAEVGVEADGVVDVMMTEQNDGNSAKSRCGGVFQVSAVDENGRRFALDIDEQGGVAGWIAEKAWGESGSIVHEVLLEPQPSLIS